MPKRIQTKNRDCKKAAELGFWENVILKIWHIKIPPIAVPLFHGSDRGPSLRSGFQKCQSLASLGQFCIRLGEAEPDQVLATIAVIERRTCHGRHASLLEQVHGFVAAPPAPENPCAS